MFDRIGIVGLGALGILFGTLLQQSGADVSILCDEARARRYRADGIICNGKHIEFRYRTIKESEPMDLILFATKASGLQGAMETTAPFIDSNTLLISLLNGINSEEQIASRFGYEHVLWCTAQGMDAVKNRNDLRYVHAGSITLGEKAEGIISPRAQALADWFLAHGVRAQAVPDMVRRQWGKLMLNDGVNQVVMVYEGTYGTIQKPGAARDQMLAAMRETQTLSRLEGYPITDDEFDSWVRLVDSLDPKGKPSMRQDAEARRPSEVQLFAGTVLKRAKKHGLETPVNRALYERILTMEAAYATSQGNPHE